MNGEAVMTSPRIPKAPAYWISPEGAVFPLFGEQKHIDILIERHKMFGFPEEYIRKAFEDENEELGVEGKAREKLIKECVGKGWIRIRYYARQDCFTANIRKEDVWSMRRLSLWAKAMAGYGFSFSNVKIDTVEGEKVLTVDSLL